MRGARLSRHCANVSARKSRQSMSFLSIYAVVVQDKNFVKPPANAVKLGIDLTLAGANVRKFIILCGGLKHVITTSGLR